MVSAVASDIPLFKAFPLLGQKLPYIELGSFPTPVQDLEHLANDIGASRLFVKRDDISGHPYGGNKVRKLEFLLGEAIRRGAKEVLTFGCVGSNHCLATSVYAKQVGLGSISMLLPQPNAYCVRDNLLANHAHGAELHLYRSMPRAALGTVRQLMQHRWKGGRWPMVIPPGGSSMPGVVGFVNAAFELKEQIVRGEAPEPDLIYVAAGTMGTAGGLILGLKAAELKSHVVGIAVGDQRFVNARKTLALIRKTNSFLSSFDQSFPKCSFSESDIEIRHQFVGPGYAHFTEEGMAAVSRMQQLEGIRLEGTYTGKTLAGLVHDVAEEGRNGTILFWNTFNSRNLTEATSDLDYHELPRCFHRYFEQNVQPLDRVGI